MQQQYDAIIVGGGILGWSTAYHLHMRGINDIAVIDVAHPANRSGGQGGGGRGCVGWFFGRRGSLRRSAGGKTKGETGGSCCSLQRSRKAA